MTDYLDSQYSVRFRGKVTGPFDEAALREMLRRNQVTRMHEISTDGQNWTRLRDMPELLDHPSSPTEQIEEVDATTPEVADLSDLSALDPAPNAPTPIRRLSREYEIETESSEPQWYYALGDQKIGPVPASVLRVMVNQRHIEKQTLVWREGMSDWQSLVEVGLVEPPAKTIPMPATRSFESRTNPIETAQSYDSIPWARRANVMRLFLLGGSFCVPILLLAPVVVVLTGEVYENNYDAQGNLKRWGVVGKGCVLLLGLLGLLSIYLLFLAYPL